MKVNHDGDPLYYIVIGSHVERITFNEYGNFLDNGYVWVEVQPRPDGYTILREGSY